MLFCAAPKALGAIAVLIGLQVGVVSAEEFAARAGDAGPKPPGIAKPDSQKPATTVDQKIAATTPHEAQQLAASDHKPAKKPRGQYYVDFRARTAASYGHAFVWYGRTDQRQVEVAGLHPASDSAIPYVIGHVLPVPSETGASYGDLDEQYLTAHYRVYLSEPDAQKVFAYIKHLQASRPLWNAAVYNCVAFVRDIAQYMGLKTPVLHTMYPENWINELRELNGRRTTIKLTSSP
jgi:hypothetical protein